MLEREAMWLDFEAEHPFAVKVFTGGVNAVSGEPTIEDLGTLFRRDTAIRNGRAIQD